MKYKNICILSLINSILWFSEIDLNNLTIIKKIGITTTLIMIVLIFKAIIINKNNIEGKY